MKIRRATDADGHGIFTLLTEHFYPEHDVGAKMPLSLEKVFEHIITHLSQGAIYVADNGEIVGVLMIKPFYPWWSNHPLISDGGFFVRKDVRSKKVFDQLMDAAEGYAASLKLPLVIDLFNKEDVDRKDVLFRRRGFSRVGGTYLKAGHVLQ